MDLARKVNLNFCSRFLSVTLKDVKQAIPEARAKDAAAINLSGGHWLFEVNRSCYGGYFQWTGRADNAYHAKAEGWSALLRKLGLADEGGEEGA